MKKEVNILRSALGRICCDVAARRQVPGGDLSETDADNPIRGEMPQCPCSKACLANATVPKKDLFSNESVFSCLVSFALVFDMGTNFIGVSSAPFHPAGKYAEFWILGANLTPIILAILVITLL